MQLIKPANSDKLIIVDDEDYEYLKQFKWWLNGRHYAYRNFPDAYTAVLMSRELLKLTPKDGKIADHIDFNPLNNQKSNLRIFTRTENSQSRRKTIVKASSRFKGVTWNKARNKWASYIYLNKKRIHLANRNDEIEAAKDYNEAALKYFKFPVLNIIP